jgi:hypothetical protein
MKAVLRATFFLMLPTLLVCVALLEVGLRMAGRLPSNTTEGIYEQHGKGYRLRRNLTKISRTPSFSHTIFTNQLGLRDRNPGHRTIVAPYIAWVGDSITFANGVEYEESFVGVFDEKASKRGIGSVNLAVGGHRFTDQEGTLHEFLDAAPVKPSWVVVVFTATGITTFEQPYTDLLVRDGYLFPAKGWLVPYVTVILGNASSAYCFFRDGVRGVQARFSAGAPKSGLQTLDPLFSRKGPWAGTEVPARFEARLLRLDERIRRSGARPIYVYMPSGLDLRAKEFLALPGREADDYDFGLFLRLLEGHADGAGIRLVNLLPVVQPHQAAGEQLTFSQDPHYTVAANRVIGEALVDALLGHADPPLLFRQ